ncbi:MAG: RNB domain-containing ribonuclease [Actinomycetota bacterium]|nr:RNB domain-containing ribonuclease [Actinomycetota bacterium]
MTTRRVRLAPDAAELTRGFERIRRQMELPLDFPADVSREAEGAASRLDLSGHGDARDIEFVTIDPPGSRDLDQALHIARQGDGYVVHYAIADVQSFVSPGQALDAESRRRGQTLYCPDERILLYPHLLSEGAASLLPDVDRPATLWTIELDADGRQTAADVRRTIVRSRRQLTYEDAQQEIERGSDSPLEGLEIVGRLRLELERERGGVSLNMPDQEVVRSGPSYRLEYRTPLPVESWNAQISLLTGMAAADIMIRSGIGLLRTMPAPDEDVVALLRRSAAALGHEWPPSTSYPDFVRTLDPARPADAALVMLATRLFRGVAYTYFEGEPPSDAAQHAIAAPYAHVTAPLRRMGDRFATEIALSICAGVKPPAWCREQLPSIPEEMKGADRRAGELERRIVDFVETVVLQARIGERFDAVVVEVGRRGGTIQIQDPAVLASCDGSLELGSSIQAVLQEADPARGRLRFRSVQETSR